MRHNKAQLMEQAAGVFEQYPDAQKLYYTTDGNFFLESKRSFAKLHAKEQKQELQSLTKDQLEEWLERQEAKSQKQAAQKEKAGEKEKESSESNDADQEGSPSEEEADADAADDEPEVEITAPAEKLMQENDISTEDLLKNQEGKVSKITQPMVKDYLNDKK